MKPALALAIGMLAMAPMAPKHKQKPVPQPSDYKPVTVYDETRDPAKDLREALREATRSKRRVLMEVGGDWCIWCHIMDNLFDSHPKLAKLREADYVRVKINYSKQNPNDAFLAHYPRIARYPHFFVLDPEGKLLRSQDTGGFEHGRSYNAKKVKEFLKKWAPRKS